MNHVLRNSVTDRVVLDSWIPECSQLIHEDELAGYLLRCAEALRQVALITMTLQSCHQTTIHIPNHFNLSLIKTIYTQLLKIIYVYLKYILASK